MVAFFVSDNQFPNPDPPLYFADRTSEKFQLLARLFHFGLLPAMKNLDFPELFVRDAYNADVTRLRQKRLYPLDMHVRVLATGTMTHVDGELEHREPVFQYLLPEVGVGFALLLRLDRQIEKHQNPHNPVFTETFRLHFSGYIIFRLSPVKHR